MQASLSEYVEPWKWGVAYLHGGLPRVWDLNLLSLDWFDGEPEQLIDEVETIMGSIGCEHRRFWVTDEVLGGQLAPVFEGFGWEVDRHVIMVRGRNADRSVDTSMVQEVGRGAWPGRARQLRSYPWCDDDDLIRQMHRFYESLYECTDARDFAVLIEESPVSFALLYSDGRTAQVEDVATLEAYRRSGLSRAVVQFAVGEAEAAGHDMIFLVADDRDWPKDFYQRLGFDAVGLEYYFLRTPDHGETT
jgi:GNAT superfamily N-acetyltransferase